MNKASNKPPVKTIPKQAPKQNKPMRHGGGGKRGC